MEVIVRYLEKAPAGFHGMVVKNSDDSFTILLDPNDSRLQNMKTYKHELEHILNDDFSKFDVQLIEANTHENVQTQLLRRDGQTARKDVHGQNKNFSP